MPRSYSFDHFQSMNPGQVHGVREHEKQAVSQQEKTDDTPGEEPKIHYGKRHAQTEEILKAKRQELEELGTSERMPPRRAAPEGEEARGEEEPRREEIREPQATRTAPIGALPESQEPPPASLFREVYDEAGRHVRVVRMAVRDITRASWRLVTLPVQVARLAARRIRSV